jgi:hypothetical protein
MTDKKDKGQIHAIVPDAVSANVRNFADGCQKRTKAGMERSAVTVNRAAIFRLRKNRRNLKIATLHYNIIPHRLRYVSKGDASQ